MEALWIGIAAGSFANVLFLALGYWLGTGSKDEEEKDKTAAEKNKIIGELINKLQEMKDDESLEVTYSESNGFEVKESGAE